MLGNRTINGHEIVDGECAKTILLQIKEQTEGVDSNFTIMNGKSETRLRQLSQLRSFIVFLHKLGSSH